VWLCVVVQAGEIALKFEPDQAQKVVQLVGPRLVEIGGYSPVCLHFALLCVTCSKGLCSLKN